MNNYEFNSLMERLNKKMIAWPVRNLCNLPAGWGELFSYSVIMSEISADSIRKQLSKMALNASMFILGLALYPLVTGFAMTFSPSNIWLWLLLAVIVHAIAYLIGKLAIFLSTDNAASIGMNHKIHGLWYIDTPFSSFVQNLDKDADVELLMGLIEEEPSERYISCPNFSKSEISLKRMFPKREQSDYNDVKDGFFLCCVARRAITNRTHLIIIDMAFTEKYREKCN